MKIPILHVFSSPASSKNTEYYRNYLRSKFKTDEERRAFERDRIAKWRASNPEKAKAARDRHNVKHGIERKKENECRDALIAWSFVMAHPDIDEMVEVLKDDEGNNSITREQLIRGFGYQVEWRELRACDYGAPTIRKRLFLIARCDGLPIFWPEPTHAEPKEARSKKLKPWRTIAECIDWSIPCNSIFLSKQDAKKVRCKRPLAAATLRRIAKGVDRYVLKSARPFIVSLTHQGGDNRVESVDLPANTITGAQRGEKSLVDATLAPFIEEQANASNERVMPADEPMRTICAGVKGGHFSLAAANLVKLRGDVATHGNAPGLSEPLHAVSAGGLHHGVFAAYLAQHNGGFNTNPGHGADEPSSTISAKGSQQQVVTASIVGFYGNESDIGQNVKEPFRTATTKEKFGVVSGALVAYYGNDKDGQAVNEPLRTVTTKERFAFAETEATAYPLAPHQLEGARRVAKFLRDHGVQFEGEFATVGGFVIWDLGMRMLIARELFRAQGFSDSYVIDRAWLIHPKTGEIKVVNLTKTQQIRMCGNSVCPPIAEALVAANSSDLSAWQKGERKKYRNQQFAHA